MERKGNGGYAHVGGGAFSGKDPSKVDRSGTYAARYLAKNIVAASLADRCEVGLSYLIGAKEAVAVRIETFGTGKTSDQEIAAHANRLLHTSVASIVSGLDLKSHKYASTAVNGHFGRGGSWEALNNKGLLIHKD